MSFRSEQEFQAWLVQKLKDEGQYLGHEVSVGGGLGRIDILTQSEVIECKISLTRESANEASGQLHYYQRFYPGKRLVIATPQIVDENARTRMTASGIEVWYVGKGFFGGVTTEGLGKKEPQTFWESPLFPLILVLLVCFLVIRLESQSKSDKQSGSSDRIEAVISNKKSALVNGLTQAEGLGHTKMAYSGITASEMV